jgi:hypothetical protein
MTKLRFHEADDSDLQEFVAGAFLAESIKSLRARDAATGEPVILGAQVKVSVDDWPWLPDLIHRQAAGEAVPGAAKWTAYIEGEFDTERPPLVRLDVEFRAPSRRSLRVLIPIPSAEFLEPLDDAIRARAVYLAPEPPLEVGGLLGIADFDPQPLAAAVIGITERMRAAG